MKFGWVTFCNIAIFILLIDTLKKALGRGRTFIKKSQTVRIFIFLTFSHVISKQKKERKKLKKLGKKKENKKKAQNHL